MALSNDLLTQFAKITTGKQESKKETTVYGTIVINDEATYVRIDGSELLTPVSTTTDVKQDDRVSLIIKNHTAVITGNLTSPAVNLTTEIDVDGTGTKGTIGQFGLVVTDKLSAQKAEIQEAYIKDLTAERAEIDELLAKKATIEQLTAQKAEIEEAYIKVLEAERAEIDDLLAKKATIEQLTAQKAEIEEAYIEDLKAERAEIDTLLAEKIDVTSADIKYAQISFANIDKAWMEEFYARSGIIEYLTSDGMTVTGTLVGLTIKGDLIEGGTIVADKLVFKGDDGLYYKLNTQAVTNSSYENAYVKTSDVIDAIEGTLVEGAATSTNEPVYSYVDADGTIKHYCVVESIYYSVLLEADGIKLEQTEYNSLNGSIITAKSITAEQISVSDLVAFDATIGGFEINENSISSTVKDSAENTVRGIYMDTDGQFNFGDSNNFVRYYREEDEEGNVSYKLAISAESIMYNLNDSTRSIADIGALTDYVKISTYEYDDVFVSDGELGDTISNASVATYVGTITIDDYSYDVREGITSTSGETVYYYRVGLAYYKALRLTEPCIELGKQDSDFKMIITNTRIMFLEGNSLPAYVSNQALNIDKAVVDDELQIGGFVWKKRANGNVGLMWKG